MSRAEAKVSLGDGGLGMPDIASSWTGLKISWLRRALKNLSAKWVQILQAKLTRIDPSIMIEDLLQWSVATLNRVIKEIDSTIWKSIFSAFKEFILKDIKQDKHHALNLNMWGTSVLKNANGRPYKLDQLRDLERNNVLPMDLLHNAGGVITVKPFNTLYVELRRCRRTQINRAREAMRLYIQDIPQPALETAMIRPQNSYWEENLNRFEKGSSHWTKILRINDNAMVKIKEQQLKWDNFLPVNHNYDYWKAQFTMVNKIKFDNRIMVNQLLITKNNMKTNIIVSKFRPITENCSYCERTRE